MTQDLSSVRDGKSSRNFELEKINEKEEEEDLDMIHIQMEDLLTTYLNNLKYIFILLKRGFDPKKF